MNRIAEIEQENIFLKYENEKIRGERDELKIALAMSHQNCSQLIQVNKKLSDTQTIDIFNTVHKGFNADQLWNDGKSSLNVIKDRLKNQKDLESVAIELALIFDKKFDRFQEILQKQ